MTLLRGYADDKPLEAWLEEDIWPAEAVLEPADIAAGTRLAAVEMARSGTTTFADMYFEVGEVVDAVREAGLRARVGHGVVTVGKDDDAAREDFAESLAVAREYDGAADGRVTTAVMPTPTCSRSSPPRRAPRGSRSTSTSTRPTSTSRQSRRRRASAPARTRTNRDCSTSRRGSPTASTSPTRRSTCSRSGAWPSRTVRPRT
jgi:hypothetical protein